MYQLDHAAGEWCNSDDYRRYNQEACENAYAVAGITVVPCVYDVYEEKCSAAASETRWVCPPAAPQPMLPPPPPPPNPPPPRKVTHYLNSGQCFGMLRDPSHLFRKMWAAAAWAPMLAGQPACWEMKRDQPVYQQPEVYFSDVLSGRHCNSNWYEGNPGQLGNMNYDVTGMLTQAAPALLGFDESIDEYCAEGIDGWSQGMGHAERCVKANLNILSLYGTRVPYNICRNLEWQVCAAKGLIPGQGGMTIKFARAPSTLDLKVKPRLGQCSGWVPAQRPEGGVYGYATDDIFYLESCIFSEICTNGDTVFQLARGEPFVCQFSPEKFRELQKLLMSPTMPDPDERQCTGVGQAKEAGQCQDWCTKWNCWQAECLGCGEDHGCGP